MNINEIQLLLFCLLNKCFYFRKISFFLSLNILLKPAVKMQGDMSQKVSRNW